VKLRPPRFGDLPLFAKLLVPFLALMLFVGAFGVFLIVRDLASRAQAALDADLARRSLDARSLLRDRELYLLESVNFAANLEGVAQAVRSRDEATAARLLQSVLALKGDLSLVALTDPGGVAVAEFRRDDPNEAAQRTAGERWARFDLVAGALRADGRHKFAGFLPSGGRDVLVIAAPVCSEPTGCSSVGAAIVGIGVDQLAATAGGGAGLAIYDADGRLLARSPRAVTEDVMPAGANHRTHTVDGGEVATLYTPFDVQGRHAGTLALSVPTAPAFSAVRGAGCCGPGTRGSRGRGRRRG
jgi:hypothetical protein